MNKDTGKYILLVDDSVDIQGLLKLLLESKGYKVHCAFNGQEALTFLDRADELPELIMLDAHMPVMDGYEFREHQAQNSRIKDIPVIVMTGESFQNLDHQMNFPDAHLLKPLQLRSVLDGILPFLAPSERRH